MTPANVVASTPKYRIEMERVMNALIVKPVGVIDEDTNFGVILEQLTVLNEFVSEVRFDLGGVVRMNSCGVREWILLMERIPARCSRVFLNLSEFFVEQLNMIPNLFGSKRPVVLTFEAPYYCPHCKMDETVGLSPKQVQIQGGKPIPPVLKCPKCAQPMEFGWIADEYLAFVSRVACE